MLKSQPFNPSARHRLAFMLPAAVDCPTRQPVSQLSAACQRFARETWNPWRRQAAASSDRCFTYETERPGIGN